MPQSVLHGLVWSKDGCGMVSHPRLCLCEGWRVFVVFEGRVATRIRFKTLPCLHSKSMRSNRVQFDG